MCHEDVSEMTQIPPKSLNVADILLLLLGFRYKLFSGDCLLFL
jgi:hypothetical protein